LDRQISRSRRRNDERTCDALRHKRAKGERVGTIPFGARLAADGVQLEPNAAEHALLAHMRQSQAAGHSLRLIAAALNRDGHRTRRGTAWRHQYVVAVLRTPILAAAA
jgi:DNA invertase Pin-like site-specific DNA recombinase